MEEAIDGTPVRTKPKCNAAGLATPRRRHGYCHACFTLAILHPIGTKHRSANRFAPFFNCQPPGLASWDKGWTSRVLMQVV